MLLVVLVVTSMVVRLVMVVQFARIFEIVLFTGTKTKTNHKNK